MGDEIIKAIVGGGGALADRENAQNQISRANSPAQLAGVIQTYKNLMAGQLVSLKKQYESSTKLNDFNDKLLPETQKELGNLANPLPQTDLPRSISSRQSQRSGSQVRQDGGPDQAATPRERLHGPIMVAGRRHSIGLGTSDKRRKAAMTSWGRLAVRNNNLLDSRHGGSWHGRARHCPRRCGDARHAGQRRQLSAQQGLGFD